MSANQQNSDMDTQNSTVIPSTSTTTLPTPPDAPDDDAQSVISAPDTDITESEWNAIDILKGNAYQTLRLEVTMQFEKYELEKRYQLLHKEINNKRRALLQSVRSQIDMPAQSTLRRFWVNVLKSVYYERLTSEDEEILVYLVDVHAYFYTEDEVRFELEFHFEKNKYFSNTLLKKVYFINCVPDPEEPLDYDGEEIYFTAGSKIDWLVPREKVEKAYPNQRPYLNSFFDFFNPPLLPDDKQDPQYAIIKDILETDFTFGSCMKKRIIPKAALFFTGECNISYMENDKKAQWFNDYVKMIQEQQEYDMENYNDGEHDEYKPDGDEKDDKNDLDENMSENRHEKGKEGE